MLVAKNLFKSEDVAKLNDLETRVLHFVLDNHDLISYLPIRELAIQTNVSTSTVLRFVKKVGFSSYNEFKYAYREYWKNDRNYEREYDFSAVTDCLNKFDTEYYQDMLDDALSMIIKSKNVIFIGIGNSAATCQYGARRFTNAGKLSFVLSDPYSSIPPNYPDTMIIAVSVSGQTREVIDIVTMAKQYKYKTIAITTSVDSPLAKLVDLTIPTYINNIGVVGFDMTSQIPTIAIIENLSTMCFSE